MGARHQKLAQAASVPVNRLRVHPRNIRTRLTQLDELAQSIRHEGVIEPLVAHRKFVRKSTVQDLELIAGHRRLAAAEIAGLKAVPCIVLPPMRDDEVILAMLGENVSRVAVEPDDLGRAVRALCDEFGHDEDSIAERLGISVPELHALTAGQQPTPDGVTPMTGGRPRSAPRPKRKRTPGRNGPTLSAKRMHDLVASFDDGTLTADDVVARLRGHLGGWAPVPREELTRRQLADRNAAAAQLDDATVAGLCDGSRTAGDATPAEIHAAVSRLTDKGMSADQIAERLGVTNRTVHRYRRGITEGRGIRAAS